MMVQLLRHAVLVAEKCSDGTIARICYINVSAYKQLGWNEQGVEQVKNVLQTKTQTCQPVKNKLARDDITILYKRAFVLDSAIHRADVLANKGQTPRRCSRK